MLDFKHLDKNYEEQERRIAAVIGKCKRKKDDQILAVWENYLGKELVFTFEAEVAEGPDLFDEPGPVEVGEVLKVTGVDGWDDLYGILVAVKHGRRKYIWELCDLEVVDKASKNYQLVDDYAVWFANR
jgi:hypothetical protein